MQYRISGPTFRNLMQFHPIIIHKTQDNGFLQCNYVYFQYKSIMVAELRTIVSLIHAMQNSGQKCHTILQQFKFRTIVSCYRIQDSSMVIQDKFSCNIEFRTIVYSSYRIQNKSFMQYSSTKFRTVVTIMSCSTTYLRTVVSSSTISGQYFHTVFQMCIAPF